MKAAIQDGTTAVVDGEAVLNADDPTKLVVQLAVCRVVSISWRAASRVQLVCV